MAKVLVVDDEKLIVKGIRFSLEQEGMEVDCAYDGIEAIEKAKSNEYDVVLLKTNPLTGSYVRLSSTPVRKLFSTFSLIGNPLVPISPFKISSLLKSI